MKVDRVKIISILYTSIHAVKFIYNEVVGTTELIRFMQKSIKIYLNNRKNEFAISGNSL